ncbi:MAG: NAD(P)H-dependent oxidoreductase subunit E [Kiritimatiellae bacterium]|nr:NAD(P)H-dependent oxidoreductase subunit E [Kiritimatiellia bacterium]
MTGTVTVEICMGTTCYVMGGAQLASIADRLPEEWKDRVTVKGMRCVGACQQGVTYGRAPFVRVNDELIAEADEGKVLNAIRSILEA